MHEYDRREMNEMLLIVMINEIIFISTFIYRGIATWLLALQSLYRCWA